MIRKPQHNKARITLAPLIDVVFILLAFFMMAMSLSDIKTIDINLPKEVNKATTQTKKITKVIKITNNGAVLGKKSFADLKSLLHFIQDYKSKKVIWGLAPDKSVNTEQYLQYWKYLQDNGVNASLIMYKRATK